MKSTRCFKRKSIEIAAQFPYENKNPANKAISGGKCFAGDQEKCSQNDVFNLGETKSGRKKKSN
jgi:hypothetical protein